MDLPVIFCVAIQVCVCANGSFVKYCCGHPGYGSIYALERGPETCLDVAGLA